MKIKKVINLAPDETVGCMGGNCPSFLLTDDGAVLVQGYMIKEDEKGSLNIPSGEDVVLMPVATLKALAERLSHE